jgi:CitMHS family citrate-Mg2+:H+ or citrate-Ca2+:H+ symporter
MIATFIILLMSGRVSPIVALILTPLVFGLLAGFGASLGPMMLKGVLRLTPTAVMLAFAVLYFSIMVDAGLFDPLVRLVVHLVHGDPVRVVTGTAVLGLLVSLDGNGASSYIICVSAMLPLYRTMRIDVRVLASVLILAGAIGHIPPWGGSTARVASILGVDAAEVYISMIPTMLVGAASVIGMAYLFGLKQRAILGRVCVGEAAVTGQEDASPRAEAVFGDLKRPKMFLVNLALTIALLAGLLFNLVPLPILFMIAGAIALQLNYPSLNEQQQRISAHAPNIFKVAAFTFAAGIFLGVLEGTGMTDAMGAQVSRAMSPAVGPFLAPIAVGISLPFYYFTTNDVFFFSVLPVLTKAGAQYGISPVEMARASIIGVPLALLSPIAASTYVLAALVGIEYRQLQRVTFKWAGLLTLILLIAAVLTGVMPWRASLHH